uniref:Uncharacterized protein n=1 Tax=Vitiosangium cumulatum TaxID=1867796 RepID=A0A7D5BDV0_9BACT|nr:hypothetical protein [Vitiosangium cumulatum]
MSPNLREVPGRSYRSFPTRMLGFTAEAPPALERRLYRFVLGVHARPEPFPEDEATGQLGDPLARLVLLRGSFPRTLRELLAALDAFNGTPEGLPRQVSYVVGDGAHIPWSEELKGLDRQFRLVITRASGSQVDLLISTGTAVESEQIFLQVAAWDALHEVFHFYQRQHPAWVWSGDSRHALVPPSRGNGPFDSHINGGLVMKELKAPWLHWHSVSATVDAALAPDDPLRSEPLFRDRASAHVLQLSTVQPGITRWNRARLRRSTEPDGTLRDVPLLMRQVLETTTVNLVTSKKESRRITPDEPVPLPASFFLNTDALLNQVMLPADPLPPSVPGRLYLEALRRYDVALDDGTTRIPGDAHFAFPVPEAAFEDVDVLNQLLQQRILSRRFAACLLMVDFPNPVYSPRRAALMRHVPPTAKRRADGSHDLEDSMLASVTAAAGALPADSPERELLDLWSTTDWERAFSQRLEAYFQALQTRLESPEGYDAIFRLAESRRREFRMLPLNEFRLTVPVSNIPASDPPLEMLPDGGVRLRASSPPPQESP